MELIDIIKQRRSYRNYKDEVIEAVEAYKIIELAKLAPSAGNMQSYKVIVKETWNEGLEIVWNIKAPLNIIICADETPNRYEDRGKNLYSVQDATIFASYFQLIAVDFGYDTLWVGAFNEGKVKRLCNIPDNLRPIIILLMGHCTEKKGEVSNRRQLNDIVL